MKTLYELLGVCPDASDEALKQAYRRLAKMHHPDLNPNDPDAARRFRQVTVAIKILCDAKRRAAYNQRLVRELQRRLDRERERRRSQGSRVIAISAAAGLAIGVVSVKASLLLRPVSPMAVAARATTYDVVQEPLMVLTATHESLRRGWSIDPLQMPAKAVPPLPGPIDRGDVSARPARRCQDSVAREAGDLLTAGYDLERLEMELGCKLPEDREADARELSANERAAMIRQAQELLASGDAKGAHLLSQRACRGPRSRCGPRSG
jgi:curved DNA-binding protein CbpA